MAQDLLFGWAMRTPAPAAADPWTPDIDNGWKDLVLSSAPPPPPREALESKNPTLPPNLLTWQEHGASRLAGAEPALDEPTFSAGDRRLWLIAGTLMGLAALVLGVLGLLTFGGASSTPAATVEAARAAPAPAHTADSPRAAEPPRAAVAATTARAAAINPRALKRTKNARHHKRMAAR